MAGNFCTQCGEPLEGEELRFCTHCGASLADGDDAGASVPASMAAGYTVPADVYQAQRSASPGGMGFAPSAGVTPGQVPHQPVGGASSGRDDKSVVRRGAVIGIIAGLVIAAIIVLVVYRPFGGPSGDSSSGGELSTTTVEEGSQPDVSDGSEGADTSGSESSDDAVDYYDDLMSYYNVMPDYDSQIADCATTFNNDYTKGDYGLRQADADGAAAIHGNVNADLEALQALDVPADNPYYEDWQHMVELMTDLQHRIDVIDQSWQNSLSYSDPANHVDDIIAPIAADNVDGTNKYKTHYQDNYDSWAPTKR